MVYDVVRIGRDCLSRRGSSWLAVALLVGKGVKSRAGGVARWLAGGFGAVVWLGWPTMSVLKRFEVDFRFKY